MNVALYIYKHRTQAPHKRLVCHAEVFHFEFHPIHVTIEPHNDAERMRRREPIQSLLKQTT